MWAASSGIQKHLKCVGSYFPSWFSWLAHRSGIGSVSSRWKTCRSWSSARYGVMSYSVSPNFRTILKSFRPVSSPASRGAAASGVSPSRMLSAGTGMPTCS